MKEYIVTLTNEERQFLHNLIATGKTAMQKLAHTRIGTAEELRHEINA